MIESALDTELSLDEQIEMIVHELRYEHRAAFIVRAVNSHAALIEALEKALDYVEADARNKKYPMALNLALEIRAALALAKGA